MHGGGEGGGGVRLLGSLAVLAVERYTTYIVSDRLVSIYLLNI